MATPAGGPGGAQATRRGIGFPCLGAVLLLALAAGCARPEPEGFKGVRWGSPPEELRRVLAAGSECLFTLAERGVEMVEYRLAPFDLVMACAGLEEAQRLHRGLAIGDVPLTDLRLFYYQDRLVALWYAFPVKDYQKVREAFLARYGPPTGTEPLADPSGTFAALETLRWTGRRVRI